MSEESKVSKDEASKKDTYKCRQCGDTAVGYDNGPVCLYCETLNSAEGLD